jgi:uroporphyrin-III C-methyltransferase/precorrin-2 dehydrogenase/sirohydrochlorin ferrochelatase
VTLPVGLQVTDRRVVAVGGGPVATARVRALADAGAVVEVVAPWLCEDLADLLADGRIAWSARDYVGPADLAGAWLAVAASGDPRTDATVRGDADRARLWCLAPAADGAGAALADTASVSTPDGTVTVAVHAPDALLASRTTRAVAGLLTDGSLDLRRHPPRSGTGWVALVGGGPGSDGLITTRGRELLAAADVVVVDRLAPQGVVDRLPASVRVVDVGKAPGRHTLPQDHINDLLVEEALAGRAVVRLKGGDPYVLGRGGEERLACEAHGIPVEVVPGVTSAVAVPAAAGIPVTHRGVARGFTVVTGHEELPAVPGGTDHTVVLLMGVGRLARSAQALMDAGRPAICPVAVVERGMLPDQRVTIGTLGDIAQRAAAVGVENPAVVVVGDVVRLSPHHVGEEALSGA